MDNPFGTLSRAPNQAEDIDAVLAGTQPWILATGVLVGFVAACAGLLTLVVTGIVVGVLTGALPSDGSGDLVSGAMMILMNVSFTTWLAALAYLLMSQATAMRRLRNERSVAALSDFATSTRNFWRLVALGTLGITVPCCGLPVVTGAVQAARAAMQ